MEDENMEAIYNYFQHCQTYVPEEHVNHNNAYISHTDAQIKPAQVNQHTVAV